MSKPTYTHTFPYDFTGLKTGELVLEAFPVLAGYPGLVEHGAGENDPWLRFALLYAMRGSGLQQIGDLDHKKREALRLAGVGEDVPRVAAVLSWQDVGVRTLVNTLLRAFDSLDYGRWFNGTEMAWQIINMLPVPPDGGSPLPQLPEGTDPAVVKVLENLARSTSDMAKDKEQRMWDTKIANFLALDQLLESLAALRAKLFMSDEELAAAVQQEALQGLGAAERRSEGQSFIPRKK